jgi:hypothetical protein
MPHDPVFDSTENRALLVVCARRTIRTAAIAGIVWGGINLALGFATVQINPLTPNSWRRGQKSPESNAPELDSPYDWLSFSPS